MMLIQCSILNPHDPDIDEQNPFVWHKTERIELHLGRGMCSGSFCPQSLPEENK